MLLWRETPLIAFVKKKKKKRYLVVVVVLGTFRWETDMFIDELGRWWIKLFSDGTGDWLYWHILVCRKINPGNTCPVTDYFVNSLLLELCNLSIVITNGKNSVQLAKTV